MNPNPNRYPNRNPNPNRHQEEEEWQVAPIVVEVKHRIHAIKVP